MENKNNKRRFWIHSLYKLRTDHGFFESTYLFPELKYITIVRKLFIVIQMLYIDFLTGIYFIPPRDK